MPSMNATYFMAILMDHFMAQPGQDAAQDQRAPSCQRPPGGRAGQDAAASRRGGGWSGGSGWWLGWLVAMAMDQYVNHQSPMIGNLLELKTPAGTRTSPGAGCFRDSKRWHEATNPRVPPSYRRWIWAPGRSIHQSAIAHKMFNAYPIIRYGSQPSMIVSQAHLLGPSASHPSARWKCCRDSAAGSNFWSSAEPTSLTMEGKMATHGYTKIVNKG